MLIPRFYPVIGGTENQCLNLSSELRRKGFSVFVLTQREKGTKSYEKVRGVEVRRLPGFGAPGVPSFGFFFTSLLFLIVNAAKYDVIHVHLATSATLSAAAAGLLLGKKLVVKFAGGGATGDIGTSGNRAWGGLKLAAVRRFFDVFTAPSESVVSEMEKAGFPPDKIKLIPNGVDTEYFSPVSAGEKNALKKAAGVSGKKVFLFMGRLAPPKDVVFLLDGWKKIEGGGKMLFIAGDGPDYGAIKKKIEHENIKDVLMTGAVKDPRKYYRMCDVFVLPTHAEGLSNSLLEAMSWGLTPLVSDIPSNVSVVKDGEDGFLFGMNDVDGFARRAEELLKSDSPLIGSRARRKITDGYSIESVARHHIEEVYKKGR